MEYAGVHLLDSPYFLDSEFDYYIPTDLRGRIEMGDFVAVPFGNANKRRIALVVSLKNEPEKTDTVCKPVADICPKKMSLSRELIGLCYFMKEQTLCTIGDAVRSMVPASALSRLVEIWRATSATVENVTEKNENISLSLDKPTLLVCEYIRKKGSVKFDLLRSKFEFDVKASLKKLSAIGLAERDYIFHDTADKKETYVSLAVDTARAEMILNGEDTEYRLRSEKHAEIISLLLENGEMTEAELRGASSATSAQIKALCDKGLVVKEARAIERAIPKIPIGKEREITLNAEQDAAYRKLCGLADSGKAHGVLLHGVTGSGKTSVMLKLIDKMVADKKGVIVLLPEIALTPQSLSIFCSRYGERVAVIHSGLTVSERCEAYNKIKAGEADVVVGTRSAVFSPVRDLGLIIIDEEQEHTYKSDMSPKYHTRDIARYRCSANGAIMLLASATPALESYKKAIDGKYTLITLKNRYGGAILPKATVVDMREEIKAGNTSPLGSLLCEKLVKTRQ